MPGTAIESNRPIFDRTKLAGLKELIGEAKYSAAIQKFQDELRACLAALEVNTPDRAEHAHKLAGVAGLLGFDDLEEKSRSLLAALHQDGEDVGRFTDSLLRAARRAEKELTSKATQ